jgi:PAS domain S-box-containing protein
LIGLLTLFQYLTGWRLHLDYLFVQPFIASGRESITAMAPNSGLAFLLAGLALLLLTRASGWRGSLVKITLGCLVLIISGTALIGYVADIPAAYGWHHFLQMAVHTGVGLLILGLGVVALAVSEKPKNGENARLWAPLLTGICVLIAAIVMGQALRAEENQQVLRVTEDAAHGMEAEITTHLNERLQALAFMARLWEYRGVPRQDTWEAEANYFIRHNVGLQAVEWVDPALQVRWVAPLQGNETVLNMKSAVEGSRREALEAAREQRQATLTGTLNLVQGGKGFLAYVPIFRSNTFDGFIVGAFHSQQFFQQALGNMLKDYSVQIHDGETLVCQLNATDPAHVQAWGQTNRVTFQEQTWQLLVTPSRKSVKEIKSAIPEVVLGAGMVVAVLLGGLVHLFQTTVLQSRALTQANLALQQDIAERKRAEEHLMESEERLRAITDSAQDAILMMDPQGRMSYWNPAAERMLGYTRAEALGQNLHELIVPERFHQAHHAALPVFRQTGQGTAMGKTLDLEARRKDGQEISVQLSLSAVQRDDGWHAVGIIRDITARKRTEAERDRLIQELQEALANVKTLTGLIPICSGCKKIRDDKNYWHQVDHYIQKHSAARFTHGMCPDCVKKYFPMLDADGPDNPTKENR